MKRKSQPIAADLLELSGRFEKWRAFRSGRNLHFPRELLIQAYQMSKVYPPTMVISVLKINHTLLKRGKSYLNETATELKPKTVPGNTFVEVPFIDNAPKQTTLEFVKPNGMRLLLTSSDVDTIKTIVESFMAEAVCCN